MELKEQYKREVHTANVNGRRVVIEDKKELFPMYKKLGLDVFKKKANDKINKGDSK